MAQAFLERGHQGFFVPGLEKNDAIGIKPGLDQGRREQVGTCETPQDRTLGACGNAGGEQGGRRAADGVGLEAGDLMQRTQRQAATGQTTIYQVQTEGQGAMANMASLEPVKALAQRLDNG